MTPFWIIACVLVPPLLVAIVIWMIVPSVRRSEDPAWMIFKWVLTLVLGGFFGGGGGGRVGFSYGGAFVVPFVCVFLGIVLSILWAPSLGAVLAKPLTSLFDGGDSDWQPQPLYSMATARRKRGKFQEAILEIQKQLARFPADVTGQLMMAEIQADDLKDISAAALTIERFLGQAGHAPKNIAYALNLLSDWQLKHQQDVDSARRTLERIGELLPDTVESQLAAQRLSHLASREMIMSAQEARPLAVPKGVDRVGLLQDSSVLKKVEEDPGITAEKLVRHLEQFPLDNEVREDLASLYASHYQRLDLALAQLRQLVDHPHQPQKQIVRWLNMMADYEIKYARNYDGARRALEEIIERFPALAAEASARQRLDHLRLELKSTEQTQDIKMGVYEQNIGLKRRQP